MELLFGFLSNHLISDIALTLIHFIWQGALLAAIMWGVLAVIPKNLFQLRYRIAVFALVIAVCLPIITFNYVDSSNLNQVRVTDLTGQSSILSDGNNNLEGQDVGVHSRQINLKNLNNSENEYREFLSYVLVIWMFGCFFMSLKFVMDLNRTFKLTKEGVAQVSDEVQDIVNNLSKKYNISRTVTILKSKTVNVPVVIGWLRPVVLLPIAITIGLERNHLELIIAHELAHIKRVDFAVNLLQNIVQICLFFHPTVYWINKVIRDEREYICDQLAVEVVGNDESAKINLAKALLGTEELREGNLSLVAVSASGGMLKHRISHILDSQYKPATSIRSVLLGLFVFTFSFAALSTTLDFSQNASYTDLVVQDQTVNYTINKETTIPETSFVTSPFQNTLKIDSASVQESTQNIGLQDTNSFELIAFKSEGESNNLEPDKAIKTVGDAGSIHPVGSTVERDSSTTTKVAPLVTAINRSGSKKQALGEQLSKASDLVTNNTIKQGNIAELSVTNNKSDIAPKTAIKDRLFNKSRVEEELFVEMSSKPVGELYSIPNFVPKEHRAKMRVASLDLKSATKFAEPKAIFTPYPKYPRRAWSKMVNQKVHVDFEIGTDGAVVNVSVAEGTVRSFAREIKRKLKLWRYEPAILAGRKVTHSTSVLFEFEAPQKKRIIPIQTGSRIKRF